jgi:hypothetical protein
VLAQRGHQALARIVQFQAPSVMAGKVAADTNPAMDAILRTLAIACSVIVGLSFAMFAVDEMDRGSKTQQQALGESTGKKEQFAIDPVPTAEQEYLREQRHSSAREAIDDANDVLLQPFDGLVTSNSNWAIRGVPSLIALLVYGLGLGLLANFLPKARSEASDWRTA